MGINIFGILTLLNLISGHSAYFNLFLSKAEVKRLLGLEAELFYVREGVTNDYAAGWTVKVPPRIHKIYFQWQSLLKKKVSYEMEILVNKTALTPPHQPIFQPTISIPLHGTVPKDDSVFTVNIPCTGYVNAELDVLLNINVSAVRKQKPLIMYLRRRKICQQGLAGANFQQRTQEADKIVHLPFTVYFLATLLTAVLVISAFFSTMMLKKWVLSRHQTDDKKCLRNKGILLLRDTTANSLNDTVKVDSTTNNHKSIQINEESLYCIPTPLTPDTFSSFYNIPKDSLMKTSQSENIAHNSKFTSFGTISCSKRCSTMTNDVPLNHLLSLPKYKNEISYDLFKTKCHQEEFKHLQMDRNRIKLLGIIEDGSIGQIYKGYLKREHPEMNQKIFIKTVKNYCSSNISKEFMEEGINLSGLLNVNVLSLVGISFHPRSPPFLIYPDPNGQNFKNYLRSLNEPVKINDIFQLSIQTSSGVAYLHSKNILHRDIATRNCIICQDLQLKICDAALSRYFFPDDYISEDALLRPLRWMSPELISCIEDFSFASDVWALGVLFWEIATNAEQPYGDISWWRILPHLQVGIRLSRPQSLSKEVSHIMDCCWSIRNNDRPSAVEINNGLQNLYAKYKNSIETNELT